MRLRHTMRFVGILNPIIRVAASHRQKAMKTISHNPEAFESTYALILRSEEKQRSRFEIFVYALLVISTVFALSQAGRQAALMPPNIQHVATISAPELRARSTKPATLSR